MIDFLKEVGTTEVARDSLKIEVNKPSSTTTTSSSAIASMAAHRTDCGKVVKIGALIEDSLNTNHSKFGVSNSNSLAPPLVQNFTHVYANNF